MTAAEALTGAGYGVGALVFWLAARRQGRDTEGTGWVALAGLAGGVLSALLVQALAGGTPGRTILGGLAGGWLAVEAAKRSLGLRRSTGDLFALALPAGEAVGRLGCFLNGCCHGTPCSLPWAVYQHEAWRHPAQLYAAAACAAIFLLLWHLRDSLPREGDLFRLYVVLYGATRFGLEFLRDGAPAAGLLTAAQAVCLAAVLATAAGWLLRSRHQPAEAPA